jgi:hypothetical protein
MLSEFNIWMETAAHYEREYLESSNAQSTVVILCPLPHQTELIPDDQAYILGARQFVRVSRHWGYIV